MTENQPAPETSVVIPLPNVADGRPVYAFPPTAILEVEHVAAWLRIGTRSAEDLDLPWFYLGTRTKRVLARDVITFCEQRRVAA